MDIFINFNYAINYHYICIVFALIFTDVCFATFPVDLYANLTCVYTERFATILIQKRPIIHKYSFHQ